MRGPTESVLCVGIDVSNHPHVRPKLRENLYYAAKGKKHLFLSPSVPDWLVVNQNGAAILGLCDGTRSATQIAETLGAPISSLADDIQLLLALAKSHSLLEGIKGEAEVANCDARSVVDRAGHAVLNTIHLQLTNKCNYRCSYLLCDQRRASAPNAAVRTFGKRCR